jgi:hypothetical protein
MEDEYATIEQSQNVKSQILWEIMNSHAFGLDLESVHLKQ